LSVPPKQPPFRRNSPRFQPQPTVLVICEDSKSSRNYLDDVKLHFRAQLHLTVTHCGKTDPTGIISEAVRQSKRFDRVFCVIDRDEHHNFDGAIRAVAHKANVTVIASYPCFEYWFLLHFGYTRKPYQRAGAKSPADCLIDDLKLHPGMANYAKGDKASPFGYLTLERFDNARKHAARALQEAMQVNDLNPSTRVHELISVIEQLGAPIPIDGKPK
jgi:hypothetical protein